MGEPAKMKKVMCILLSVCISGGVFARDFEAELAAELAASEKSRQKGWGNYALGLGIMIAGTIFTLATSDPEGDNTLPILVGGGAVVAGSLILLYGEPSMGESAAATKKAGRLQYVIDHPELSDQDKNAIADGKIYMGMKEEHLVVSWGEPRTITASVGSWGVHKQYVYGSFEYGTSQYVYVENGVVVSWQT